MKIINFLLFQIAWLVTIFSAAKGMPYIGVIFTLLWIFVHFFAFKLDWQCELKLFLFAAALGYILESLLVITDLVDYPSQAVLGVFAPIWMVTLWVNLAVTLNHSLSWLQNRYFLSAIMASIAGPIAYAAGEKIGAINLHGMSALYVISCMWLLAMPLLFWISNIINKQDSLSIQGITNIGNH